MREEKPFSESLEELINIFGKIRRKAVDGKFGDIDISFLDDFDILMKNYSIVKEGVSPNILDSVSEPLRELVSVMINQLRDEMDKVFELASEEEKTQFSNDLDKINESLKKPNLSEEEMDFLLDQRKILIKKSKSE